MKRDSDPANWLVAHRGHASEFPENTRSSLEAAARLGMRYLEFDLQFTADDVPVVIHDPDLRRTSAVAHRVAEIDSSVLGQHYVGYPERFGGRFGSEPLLALADLVPLFEAWPEVVPVVEIKREGAFQVGVARAVETVCQILGAVLERSVVISFSEAVVQAAQQRGAPRTGWCLENFAPQFETLAKRLAPDYLLVDYRKITSPTVELWSGPWQWVAWEVTDPELALSLRRQGVDLVETMDCERMIKALRRSGGQSGYGSSHIR